MIHEEPQFLDVGEGAGRPPYRLSPPRASARRRRASSGSAASVRHGLDQGERARRRLRASAAARFLRFDYSGHGGSDGRFEDGTISRWLEESAGGRSAPRPRGRRSSSARRWAAISRCCSRARWRERAKRARLAGMVLIAPAVDFTEALIWARAPRGGAARDPGEGRVASARPPIPTEPYVYHPRADRGRPQASAARRHRSAAIARSASCRACRTRTCPIATR